MKLFVTVGTTSFDELIKSVNSQKVLDFLVEMGFDEIVYQIGRGSYIPCNPLNSQVIFIIIQSNETFHYKTLKISYYKYKDSLGPEITSSDLIIGHAGNFQLNRRGWNNIRGIKGRKTTDCNNKYRIDE